MITSIVLNQLVCAAESNGGGSHPYLWAELLQIDNRTIDSGALVASIGFAPPPIGAQLVITEGMRAGDTAPIPAPQARLAAQFDQAESIKDLILVAVLWDRHDTPIDAILAGYDAFLGSARDAVAKNLEALSSASGDVVNAAVDEVRAEINQQVNDAISGKLSTLDKVEIAAGLETSDSVIGSAFVHFALAQGNPPSGFSLAFGSGSTHDYRIDGTITVTVDPCESELIRVQAANQAIANTRSALKQLIGHEGPATEKQIEILDAELSTQQARLAAAQADLNLCRIGTTRFSGF
jgi:hypothetical protein